MAVAFLPGGMTARGDLDIFLEDSDGNPTNAAEISFALYYVDPGPPEVEVLQGAAVRVPVNPAVGEYYASLAVPTSAAVGTYRIRWTFKRTSISPAQQVVQEFAVVQSGSVVVAPTYPPAEQEMINRLRLLLRDQHPDKFYHFRPPEFEGNVGQYNRVFGQIWQDDELLEYCQRGLDWMNSAPPYTNFNTMHKLATMRPQWTTTVCWIAISHACFALAINWVADEFDYSIGGVSLTIEKSSKYESLKQNAEGQADKGIEWKARTEKHVKGLQQPRFGLGVRSSFGPNLGKGVLSPRSFM